MIKRLLAFAVGFALATLAEASLHLVPAHAQACNQQIQASGPGMNSMAPVQSDLAMTVVRASLSPVYR